MQRLIVPRRCMSICCVSRSDSGPVRRVRPEVADNPMAAGARNRRAAEAGRHGRCPYRDRPVHLAVAARAADHDRRSGDEADDRNDAGHADLCLRPAHPSVPSWNRLRHYRTCSARPRHVLQARRHTARQSRRVPGKFSASWPSFFLKPRQSAANFRPFELQTARYSSAVLLPAHRSRVRKILNPRITTSIFARPFFAARRR